MIPSTETVLLNRVTLRGTTETIDAARAPLKTALEQSSWPTTAPGELLFLRRITASGNPREIAARAAEQARRLAENAVDGWSAAAPNALAVRFRSHVSLLACLIRDLLHGNAQHHWYWRRWRSELQRPTGEALVALLEESPLQLPAVVARLYATQLWQPFWQNLSSSGAERLLTVAAQAAGWSATVQAARQLIASNDIMVAPALIPRQQTDLGFLNVAATDSRPLLAALLALWQQAPTLLAQTTGATGAEQLCLLTRAISGELPTTPTQPVSPNGVKLNPGSSAPDSTVFHPDYSAKAPSLISVEKQHEVEAQSIKETMPTPTLDRATSSGNHFELSVTGSLNPATPKTDQETDTKTVSETESTAEIASATTTYKTTFEHNFTTHQGGLLYLINFLNLPPVRAQLPTEHAAAGWRWLYDLASAIGCPPTGALLEFIANECGMKNGAMLTQQPPLATMEQITRLGASRYGDAVWQAKTWQIPARLIADSSHVNLHFRLNDACLSVRRVGLDINPGWVPWLGRVVTFHYGSGLEPQQ